LHILTTDANELVQPIHDRMPVILPEADYTKWLDPKPRDPGELLEMLRPYPAGEMATRPVGLYVNNARFDDAKCLESA
jgi:putative SOS response-associated peptidase YedK